MPWSDWQDPWLSPVDVANAGKYFSGAADSESDGTTSSAVIADLVDDAKTAILAGLGTTLPGAGSSEVLAESAGGRTLSPISTGAGLALGYSAGVFDGADYEADLPIESPPLLSTLTFGVDYIQIPPGDRTANTDTGNGSVADYESFGKTFSTWDTFHGDMLLHISLTATDASLDPSSITVPLRFWTTTALTKHTGNATDNGPLSYAPSGVIGDLDFVAVGHPGYAFDFFDDVGDLDISGQSEAFTLVVQPRWMGADTPYSDEIAVGPPNSYSLAIFSRGFGSAQPRALYTTPRWRYWIPDTDVSWHTLGGHFATVGPAGMRILTPGVGWVPVADGPA
jgi:hypothetical protein